jgi:solute carrier family 25 (mitochondrial ornithine transporter) member 2/15
LKSKDDLGVLSTAFCGGLGGVSLWISIFPADVVKSRVQVDSNSELAKKSFFNAMRHIAQTEGLKIH